MKRSMAILVAILVVLGVATYLVLQRPGEQSSSGLMGEKLVNYDSAAVDRIEVTTRQERITLAREAGIWMLKEPVTYRADEALVTQMVGKGRSIELKSLVSSNPQKQQVFDLDSAGGALVRVYERGTETSTFRIGKASASFTETYVRRENSTEVYLGDGIFGYLFNRQARDWRDKSIYQTEQSSISSVRFQYGDTLFTLVRKDSLWFADRDTANESSVNEFLGALAKFQTDEFVDSTIALQQPKAVIETGGTQLQFYPHPTAGRYYVRSSASPQVFEIQSWRASQLLKRKKDFLPPRA